MPDAVLTQRALNRALLARQLLLERRRLPVADALVRLVGLQAQVPSDPYVGLWARLDPFDPEELGELITSRRAVRISLMRGTVHLVTAGDCVALRPVLQAVNERSFLGQFRRQLDGLDLDALLVRARELLDEKPRPPAELGRLLAVDHPDRDPMVLQLAARYLLPLVQVPPRGVLGVPARTSHALADRFLGRPLGEETEPDATLLRYLAAFGPATVADARTWSGLTGLREPFERLRPRLRTFRDERGRELFDVPDGAFAPEDAPAPARLLPEYDNLLLSHDDRSRVVPPGRPRPERVGTAAILVDGMVAGTWRLERERDAATLRVRPDAPLGDDDGAAVEAEAAALLGLLAAGVPNRSVVFD
jgi:hypothetical protein